MQFTGTGTKRAPQDITAIARKLRVKEAWIYAIIDTETSGHGFDKANRPDILFEPHIFYRQLGPGAKRDKAVSAGLAYPKWGERPYPRDSYPRLEAAVQIDETAALNSCSWGLGQVMGSEHGEAGFATTQDFVEAMKLGEREQLDAMANLILHRKLDVDMRANKFAGFARIYNGAGYAKNHYDTKLEAAYRKHGGYDQKTPDLTEQEEVHAETADVIAPGDKGALVHELQTRLTDVGFPVGNIDDDYGTKTRRAVRLFQLDHDLPGTGRVDPATWAALKATPKVEQPPERANETAEGLAAKGSVIASQGLTLESAGKAGTALAVTGGVAQNSGIMEKIQDLSTQSDTAKGVYDSFGWVIDLAKDNWWILAAAGAGIVWYLARDIVAARLKDHQTGKANL